MKISGARIVLECLKREGVDLIFGLPGGAVLPIYDALYDFQGTAPRPGPPGGRGRPRGRGLRAGDRQGRRVPGHLGPGRHEPGHGAPGRADGLDPDRRVHRAGADAPIGNDAFQEADNVGITRSATKHNFLVKDGKDLAPDHPGGVPHRGHRAPGPGARRPAEGHPRQGVDLRVPGEVHLRSYNPTYEGHPGQIKKAARLADAGQAAGALRRRRRHLVGRLARAAGAGRADPDPGDARPSWAWARSRRTHPLSLGMLGMHGTLLRQHGGPPLRLPGRGRRPLRRPGDRQGGRVRAARRDHPHRHRSLVDLEEHQGRRPDRGRLQARAARSWSRPCARSEGRACPPPVPRGARAVARAGRRVAAGLPAPLRLGRRRHQAPVRHRRRSRTSRTARRSSSPAWASTRCGPPSTTASSTRGTGAPRAGSAPWATGCRRPWACRPAHPGKLVINIDGDGSFEMNSQELATASPRTLPVKTVIINNGGHGMVRQWQRHHLQGALHSRSTCRGSPTW